MNKSTIAKGTASIELAGGAEIATAAESEALGPGAYGEPGRRCEAHYKARPDVLSKCRRERAKELEALPRGLAQPKGAATKKCVGIDMQP